MTPLSAITRVGFTARVEAGATEVGRTSGPGGTGPTGQPDEAPTQPVTAEAFKQVFEDTAVQPPSDSDRTNAAASSPSSCTALRTTRRRTW